MPTQFWYPILYICCLEKELTPFQKLRHQSTYEYILGNCYYTTSSNLILNTCFSGKCTDDFCIILCYHTFKWKYIQLGKYYFTCLETSMPLNCDTTVIIVISICVLVFHGKCEDILSIELYSYAIY
jgi:hypothetical protein